MILNGGRLLSRLKDGRIAPVSIIFYVAVPVNGPEILMVPFIRRLRQPFVLFQKPYFPSLRSYPRFLRPALVVLLVEAGEKVLVLIAGRKLGIYRFIRRYFGTDASYHQLPAIWRYHWNARRVVALRHPIHRRHPFVHFTVQAQRQLHIITRRHLAKAHLVHCCFRVAGVLIDTVGTAQCIHCVYPGIQYPVVRIAHTVGPGYGCQRQVVANAGQGKPVGFGQVIAKRPERVILFPIHLEVGRCLPIRLPVRCRQYRATEVLRSVFKVDPYPRKFGDQHLRRESDLGQVIINYIVFIETSFQQSAIQIDLL